MKNLSSIRPCRLEGYTFGHLDGWAWPDLENRWRVISHCGSVKIHVSAATALRKYESESCPTFYYE